MFKKRKGKEELGVVGIKIIIEDKDYDGGAHMCTEETNQKEPCGEFATVNTEILSTIPDKRISLVEWSVGEAETEELW